MICAGNVGNDETMLVDNEESSFLRTLKSKIMFSNKNIIIDHIGNLQQSCTFSYIATKSSFDPDKETE